VTNRRVPEMIQRIKNVEDRKTLLLAHFNVWSKQRYQQRKSSSEGKIRTEHEMRN
jgi:hypothetical protein